MDQPTFAKRRERSLLITVIDLFATQTPKSDDEDALGRENLMERSGRTDLVFNHGGASLGLLNVNNLEQFQARIDKHEWSKWYEDLFLDEHNKLNQAFVEFLETVFILSATSDTIQK